MLTALAVLLAILVLVVEPLGIPYYATTAVDVKSFESPREAPLNNFSRSRGP